MEHEDESGEGVNVAGFFPQAWLDELRNRVDLVGLASEYVPLTQKGRRYWACCPFHQEKTPSFSIDADKQMYYCFGCKAAGNVFNFVMTAERLDFVGAVQYLAEKYNVPLPENDQDAQAYQRQHAKRERMYQIMTMTARYFRDKLNAPEGAQARAYLQRRGVSESMIRRFGLGYAPDSWNGLKDMLGREGVALQQAQELGLLASSKGRVYDAFRNRLMFPIFDERGRVVAFGGRVLDDSLPKYINSPETPIFNKRKTLYGIQLLKKQRELKNVVITEGYMDVIAMWQAGLSGALATMGTSMTQEQARILRRYVPRVILLYDGDAAGQNASLRGMDILVSQGLGVRVASLPDNLDPDEMIRRRGVQAMNEQLEKAMPLTAFRLAIEKRKWDLSDTEQRTQYAMAAAKIISQLESPLEQESYLKTLQVQTGFSMNALLAQTKVAQHVQQTPHKITAGGNHQLESVQLSPDVRAQRELICTLIQMPGDQWPAQLQQLQQEDFDCPACRAALSLLQQVQREQLQIQAADIYTRLSAQGDQVFADVLVAASSAQTADPSTMREWITRRIERRERRRIETLKKQLASQTLDDAQKMQLLEQIQQGIRELQT